MLDRKNEGATGDEKAYTVIGSRPIRPDGLDKVTGRALYGADVRLPGLLRGRVLRSPHAHARIKGIDTARARALPGVKAIVTASDFIELADKVEDLGEGAVNLRELSANILAREKALYRGHAVAAVAAVDDATARAAVDLIEVDYEPLPPVLEVRAAMRPGATLLDERRRTASLAGESEEPSNVAAHLRFEIGDVEEGFRQAHVVLEHEYRTPTVHQGYIEPQNATALWSGDALTIWTSTQGAFAVRDQVADVLQVPVGRVKVVPMEIGGGFGGKIPVYLEPVAALLARQTGRPVQLAMSRAEVFEGTGPAPATSIRLKMGATRDGRIVAAQADVAYEAGAFPGSAVSAGCMCMLAPYDLPNVLIDGYDVVVNKPKSAAYRAPGAPQAAFAAESMLDELAERLGLDPLELRLRHASHEGTQQVNGQPFPRIGFIETLRAAMASEHWRSPLATRAQPVLTEATRGVRDEMPAVDGPRAAGASKRRGRGVASGFWFNGGMKSSASASVNADGSVSLVEGSTDIGGTRASLAMQLAETLGIQVDLVHPSVADTDSVGYTAVTGGSRTTFATGWAAYEVGMDIRRQLVSRAAAILEVPEDDLVYESGAVRSLSLPSRRLSFKELAAEVNREGAPVIGRAAVSPEGVGSAFATHVVDLEVDALTGKVDVLRYTAVQDVGTAIHPGYVEGQMQGGAAQGIGWALDEEYVYDESGRQVNASFLDYRMPTSLDLPAIDALIVEVPNPGHPYGVRGVGEVPIVPPLAAVANALHQALGVRFRELPISPRRVLEETILKAEGPVA